MEVPSRPDPPVVGKVTHYSIELYWKRPSQGSDKISYCIQEEESSAKGGGYGAVYNGFALSHTLTGLEPQTQYKFRLRAGNSMGYSPWSPTITVATTGMPITGETLHRAVNRDSVESVVEILEAVPNLVDVTDNFGNSPLMVTCRLGSVKMAKALLDHNADIDFTNKAGHTCVMEACYYGHLSIVELLREKGASWLTRDKGGLSPIHWAVDGGHIDVVQYILNDGMDVDDTDGISKWTPLMRLASLGGSIQMAQVLIDRGAKVNKLDNEGKSVLMLATLRSNEQLVKLLLKSGADAQYKNGYGKTALDFAMTFNRKELISTLESHTNVNNEEP
ncbi:fibronectin type 3 and ankyrin repeat domains protein 1-like [Dysidea avara]|uniref:fibronectin type 3 and ankyrin repeat domains protein 1-like n=1 Tax=Dysidea avara TaxID=196820 RepID=UPI0033291D12